MKIYFDTGKIILMQWGQEWENAPVALAGKTWPRPLTQIHALLHESFALTRRD